MPYHIIVLYIFIANITNYETVSILHVGNLKSAFTEFFNHTILKCSDTFVSYNITVAGSLSWGLTNHPLPPT